MFMGMIPSAKNASNSNTASDNKFIVTRDTYSDSYTNSLVY